MYKNRWAKRNFEKSFAHSARAEGVVCELQWWGQVDGSGITLALLRFLATKARR
jgi:hypothetical protein